MTISGKYAQRQVRWRRLAPAVLGLGVATVGLWVFYNTLIRVLAPGDPLRIAAIAFWPVIGAVASGLLVWSDRWIVVEFTCDETEFRFWKLWSLREETRAVSDVEKIGDAWQITRYSTTWAGYEVTFRDSSQILLGRRLPRSGELAGLLDANRTPAPPGPSRLGGFIRLVFGRLEFVPLSSQDIEARVRQKYRSQITVLTGLGFDYLCCYGEAFSPFRLALVVPAIAVLGMWVQGFPVRIGKGLKVMACYALLISGDRTTYANPCESGAKLCTRFTDGTPLVSATGQSLEDRWPTAIHWCGGAGIDYLWESHRHRVEDRESAGKRADRKTSFETYVSLARWVSTVL
jgi:hypothetical protein